MDTAKTFCAALLTALAFSGCLPKSEYSKELEKIFSAYGGEFCIVTDKKRYELSVYNRKHKLVALYKAGYGMNPDGGNKLFAGDNRTPEGLYYVNEILSMDAAKDSQAYKKLKSMNSVYFRARDGHYKYGSVSEDLGADAYGPRFYRINYPDEADLKRYQDNIRLGVIRAGSKGFPGPGGGIAIHGNNDPEAVGHKSSSGCIRLYNRDVIELERYIVIGTPVLII